MCYEGPRSGVEVEKELCFVEREVCLLNGATPLAPTKQNTYRHSLGTCHSKGAAVVVEEDATTMTKFFLVRFIVARAAK